MNKVVEFKPRYKYKDALEGSPDYNPDEHARLLRDKAMATAGFAYTLSPDEPVRIVEAGHKAKTYWPTELERKATDLFYRSFEVDGQTELSQLVTGHHLGRALILRGETRAGLNEMREVQAGIEAQVGEDRQLLVNMLGGISIAEAAFGDFDAVSYHGHRLNAQIKELPVEEKIKSGLNLSAVLAIGGLRKLNADQQASALAKRALRGPIRYKTPDNLK